MNQISSEQPPTAKDLHEHAIRQRQMARTWWLAAVGTGALIAWFSAGAVSTVTPPLNLLFAVGLLMGGALGLYGVIELVRMARCAVHVRSPGTHELQEANELAKRSPEVSRYLAAVFEMKRPLAQWDIDRIRAIGDAAERLHEKEVQARLRQDLTHDLMNTVASEPSVHRGTARATAVNDAR